MNRIYEAVGNDCKFNLFADDTLISVAENSLEEAVTKINKTLESLSKWFKQHKLKLNAEKTKYMVITYRKNIQIDTFRVRIDDVELERVTEIKYLGVIIDDKLKFDSNVEYIIKKAAKKVNLIGRLSNKLTTNSKIMLYKSIVAPHFDYCSSILFLANEGQFQEMQRVQNKMMRIILRCSRETRIIDMLSTLYWMTIKQRVYYNTLIMIFKIDRGELPEYLSINLIRVRDSHTRTTRSGNDFVLPRFTKTSTQNSLFYKGVNLYNELQTIIRQKNNLANEEMTNTISLNEFKRHCSKFVKEKIV
jgi:Reverse transcriptase (RNA-dependent DNA polymerase)